MNEETEIQTIPLRFKRGQKVHYKPAIGPSENGVVKGRSPYSPDVYFVVFKCGGNWDRYQDFAGEATQASDLREGWND